MREFNIAEAILFLETVFLIFLVLASSIQRFGNRIIEFAISLLRLFYILRGLMLSLELFFRQFSKYLWNISLRILINSQNVSATRYV